MESDTRNLPWVEKYRPKKIDDIVSHQNIVKSIREFINSKSLPHLLFYGPPGCGKTSMIMSCANEIYGKDIDYMIRRLNASNERGIEIVRTTIKNFVNTETSFFANANLKNTFKLVILDEIDSMTMEAQGMLRQIIDSTSMTTRFCLICNYVYKIHPALQSRCTNFRFSPLNPDDMKKRIIDISKDQSITIDNDSVDTIIKISKGDMRISINTLQQVYTSNAVITSDLIYKMTCHCSDETKKTIIQMLFELTTKTKKMEKVINDMNDIIIDNNIVIPSVLNEIKDAVINSSYNIRQKIYIITNLAAFEIYDSQSINQKIIIMCIVSTFIIASQIKK